MDTASAFSVAPVVAEHLGWKAGACAFALATGTALDYLREEFRD